MKTRVRRCVLLVRDAELECEAGSGKVPEKRVHGLVRLKVHRPVLHLKGDGSAVGVTAKTVKTIDRTTQRGEGGG